MLLPVWFMTYKHKNKDYFFAMNGQTGKINGALPVSAGKLAAWSAGICAAMAALFVLLTNFGGL